MHYAKRDIPILRRQPEHVPFGADPLCAYDALRTLWLEVAARTPRDQWARTPLFQTASGEAVRTRDVDAIVGRAASALGLDARLYGAKSLRIGGATDLLFLNRSRLLSSTLGG